MTISKRNPERTLLIIKVEKGLFKHNIKIIPKKHKRKDQSMKPHTHTHTGIKLLFHKVQTATFNMSELRM